MKLKWNQNERDGEFEGRVGWVINTWSGGLGGYPTKNEKFVNRLKIRKI